MAYANTYQAEAYAIERMMQTFGTTTDDETENHVEYWHVLDEWTDYLIQQSETYQLDIETYSDFEDYDQILDDIIKKHTL